MDGNLCWRLCDNPSGASRTTNVITIRYLGCRVTRFLALVTAISAFVACGGTPASPSSTITRERAIEIARSHVSFEPTSVDAQQAARQSKEVWVVTLRRADGSHRGLGQFAEVTIDRATGEVVTIAMS